MSGPLPSSMHIIKFCTLLFASSLCLAVQAQEAPRKEISEQVSGELSKLKALVDGQKLTEAVQLLDQLLTTAEAESYDVALISQIKAQILMSQESYTKAGSALEKAHQLGERHGYFDQRALLEQSYLLCQIYYQLASQSKDPVQQNAYFEKAYANIREWLEKTPKPTVEAQVFASTILFNQATMDKDKTDLVKLRQARDEATKGLYLAVKPSDQLYLLVLSTTQQLGDLVQAADILELLAEKHPTTLIYWQQLVASYLNLAAETKNEAGIFQYNLRAILTVERAQKNGFMNTPKDHLNLVGMYFNIQQYARASELIESGLKAGQLENSARNWQMLASSYQQIGEETKALNALVRATQALPKDGQLEHALGQLYYATGNLAEANRRLAKAVEKGNLEKLGGTYLFLAYTSYELQDYPAALKWAELAEKQPDTRKEDIQRITRAIKESLNERTALKSSKI